MLLDISADDLRLDYRDGPVLNGLTFELTGGRIYGLFGRNGAGKTSLANLLAGFRPPTSGRLRIADRAPFDDPQTMAHTCLIQESGNLHFNTRVRDTLRFASRLRPFWDAELAAELVDGFELPEHKRSQQLSLGGRAALSATLGLASRAPVTIFDEVDLGMDAAVRDFFYRKLLEDYLAHPRTIIVSTHLIAEISHIVEEVLVLDDGRLLRHDTVDSLREEGVTLTGPAEAVDRITADLQLAERTDLGTTIRATAVGRLTGPHRREAEESGVEVGLVPLQDLVVSLTNTATAPADRQDPS